MMTMDVSMYGNQHQHQHQHAHQHAHGQHAQGEGFAQGGGGGGGGGDYPEHYYSEGNELHYYPDMVGTCPQLEQQADHIISADNGLSYTNLDYGYQQYGGHPYQADMHYQPYKPELPYLQYGEEGPAWAGGPGCLEYPGGYKGEAGGQAEDCYRPDAGARGSAQQGGSHHHGVPTYKWMQVKRNVPKPAGEFFLLSAARG